MRNSKKLKILWEPDVSRQELQQIKEQALADGTFMKAPNGRPTNLTEQQWLQVRTRFFKDWFGEWQLNKDLVSLIDNKNNTIDYGKLKDITDSIERGDQTLGRLTQREETGRIEGSRRNVEASLILRAKESANRTQQKRRSKNQMWRGHKQHVKWQEDLLEQYARHKGIWFEFDNIQQANSFLDQGMEAKVFEDSNNKEYVLKVVGYDFARSDTTPQDYLDRITLHNYLFPEAKYELFGFTKDGEFFKFVVRQKFVEGDPVSEHELIAYMRQVYEAESVSITHARYANPNYFIDDLHELNVIKGANGELYFIDPIVSLNYKDDHHGGIREKITNQVSKVVDKNGEPKVVCRGTTADFKNFDPDLAQDTKSHRLSADWGANKFYFIENSIADQISAEYARQTGCRTAPANIPVYLDIRNPITAEEYMDRVRALTGQGMSRDGAVGRVDREIQSEGYDGIMDEVSGGMAVFELTQVMALR